MSRDGSERINGDRINGLVITDPYKWGMNWGYNPLILTIDPNFLGHPSSQLVQHCQHSPAGILQVPLSDRLLKGFEDPNTSQNLGKSMAGTENHQFGGESHEIPYTNLCLLSTTRYSQSLSLSAGAPHKKPIKTNILSGSMLIFATKNICKWFQIVP